MSTMVRILPMDKITEFKNMASDKVQSEFFLKEMPSPYMVLIKEFIVLNLIESKLIV